MQFILVSAAMRRQLVPLSDVREIVAMMALEEVEGRTGRCRGVANLRGEIVPVFDASGPNAALSPSRYILISSMGDDPIGVVVDEIHDVLELDPELVVTRPTGARESRRLARLGEEVLPLLEPALVVSEDD